MCSIQILKNITVFLRCFAAFLESPLIFAKQFVQTAPHSWLPSKAYDLLKIFMSISQK